VKILEIIIIIIVFSIISSIISSAGKQQKRNAPPASTKFKAPRAKASRIETRGVQMTVGHDQRFKVPKAKTTGAQGNRARTVGPQPPMAYSPELYNSSYSTAGQGNVSMDKNQAKRINKGRAKDFIDDMIYSDDETGTDLNTPVFNDIERAIPNASHNQQPTGLGIEFNRNTLITGIIFSQILSPPRGRRPYKRMR
jgi:hypothetical protein